MLINFFFIWRLDSSYTTTHVSSLQLTIDADASRFTRQVSSCHKWAWPLIDIGGIIKSLVAIIAGICVSVLCFAFSLISPVLDRLFLLDRRGAISKE